MKKKKTEFSALILSNLFLLFIIIILIFGILPTHWRESNTFTITQMNESGGLDSATIYSYSPNSKFFQADKENVKYGQARMNKLYIEKQLSSISEQYVRKNGFEVQMKLDKQATSSQDFCYTISGAPNGEVWNVWVVCPSGEEPRIMVCTNEEVQS